MRQMSFTAACLLAACGGGGGPGPSVDAKLTIVDGVILFPDAPVPDATSATTGAIVATIRCSGAGCGKQGNIRLVVDDCASGVIANKLLFDETLTQGVDITDTTDSLAPAMYCATAYLDVSPSGLGPGDITASAGATHVMIVAAQETPAVIVLDTLHP
jgi:hypothetical protein